MTEGDETAFMDFARTTGEVYVIPDNWATAEIPLLSSLPEPETDIFWWSVSLYNAAISKNLVSVYVPQQHYYVLDSMQSSVVEFARSIQQEDMLIAGRLYLNMEKLEQGHLVKKEPELDRWYNGLVRWLRRYATHREGVWVAPGAARWASMGGRLVKMHL